MPFYHEKSNTIIGEGSPFELDGVQYPANWLNLSSPEDKIEHGLLEIIEAAKPDYDPAKQGIYQGDLVERDNHMERQWLVRDFSESELKNQASQARNTAKAKRAEAVDSIVVTTSTGKVFDGDELSQGRMSRAILVMQALGAPVTTWVLHDNTPTEVTLAELTEALALAGQEQSKLWNDYTIKFADT